MSLTGFGQQKCIEHFENLSLYNPRFKHINNGSGIPLLNDDSSVIYNSGTILFKKNKLNTVEWLKKNSSLITAKFANDNSGIISSFIETTGINPTVNKNGIMELSPLNGLPHWAKEMNHSLPEFNNFGYVSSIYKGKSNDIILCNAIGYKLSLTILSEDGNNIKLFKNYDFALLDGYRFKEASLVIINNSIFITAITVKYQLVPSQIRSSNLLLLKLNYQTGSIEKMNHIHINDQISGANLGGIQMTHDGLITSMMCKAVQNDFIIAGRKAVTSHFDNNRFFSIKVDTNLLVKDNKIFKAYQGFTFYSQLNTELPYINKQGSVLFAAIRDTVNGGASNKCNYFIIDSGFNILAQKQLNISSIGLQTFGLAYNVIPLLKDDNKAELIFHASGSFADSLVHIVDIPYKVADEPCRSFEQNFIMVETPTYNILTNPTVSAINSASISFTPLNLILVDENIDVRKFCTDQSICDTIKITGPSKICLPQDTATYGLVKNPLCKRKTVWQTDTSALKIIATERDNIIKVKIMRPYTGYIKAWYDGCELADSLLVQISAAMPALSAGNDTILCPGRLLTLKATPGFRTYQWSTGSNADTTVVSSAGVYYLTATDSCDNEFADTVSVNAAPATLEYHFDKIICQYDTAHIVLDNRFSNYAWQPIEKGIMNNGQLHLFPGVSTFYTVTAELLPGCVLSDTLYIGVENCPIYFYVPNAFTPNNDGINDVFKPLIKGPLQEYRIEIYNRFGNKVFASTNPQKGWNGQHKNTGQDNAVFVWVCSYRFAGRETVNQKGTVMLIR